MPTVFDLEEQIKKNDGKIKRTCKVLMNLETNRICAVEEIIHNLER